MSSLNVSPNDSDLNFNNFINSFMTIFEKHAPMKTKRVKNENQPEWFNEHIKRASKTRDMYHKAKTGLNIYTGETKQRILYVLPRKISLHNQQLTIKIMLTYGNTLKILMVNYMKTKYLMK